MAGGQTALARKCGKRQGHVQYWLTQDRVTADTAVLIERATEGKITRRYLRPDLFEAAAE